MALVLLLVDAVLSLPYLGQVVVVGDDLEGVVAGRGAEAAAAGRSAAHVQPLDLRSVSVGARHPQRERPWPPVGEVALRHPDLLLDVEWDVQLVGDDVLAGHVWRVLRPPVPGAAG